MTQAPSQKPEIDTRLMHLSAALLVERDVRNRRNAPDLAYYLVNETVRVHEHQLGFLLLPKGQGWGIMAASDVTTFEETSPLGDWLRRIAKAPDNGVAVRLLETASLSPPGELSDALPGQMMWLPLAHPDGGLAGLLILLRDHPWQERDRLLAEPLAECYGHALIAVGDRPWFRRPKGVKARMIAGGVAAFFIGAGFWPVSLTALAPAEVVAADPVPVTAPFDGIVSEVPVRPYETVTAGQTLVLMDNTELTMERNLARKVLAVAVAELNGLRHQAFLNPGSKAKLAVWDKKVELRRQSLANAEEKLSRHRLSSPSAKVVLFDDRYNWAGRPAKAGQRLMTLADPESLEVQIDLPAASLIPLKEGDTVTLFLDMAPSRPIKARLSRIGYQARATPSGMMAYRYRASLEEKRNGAALGARGTARLEGEMVSLAYSLFRRPMAALRQFLGL